MSRATEILGILDEYQKSSEYYAPEDSFTLKFDMADTDKLKALSGEFKDMFGFDLPGIETVADRGVSMFKVMGLKTFDRVSTFLNKNKIKLVD